MEGAAGRRASRACRGPTRTSSRAASPNPGAFEKDGATVVLKVRPGVKFPSGRPVDAAALKYSLDRAPAVAGLHALHDSAPARRSPSRSRSWCATIHRRHQHEGPTPQPMVLNLLALINNTLLDPEMVKANATEKDPWATDWCKRNAAGSGPYTLVNNDAGRRDRDRGAQGPLARRAAVRARRLQVRAQRGRPRAAAEAQGDRHGGRPSRPVAAQHQDRSRTSKDFKIVTVPDTTCHWLCMNSRQEAVRQRQGAPGDQLRDPDPAIMPNVLMGYGAQMKSPVPSLTPGYDGTLSPYKYDIDKAKALMKEAGVGKTPIDARPGGARRLAAARAGGGLDPERAGEDRLQDQHHEADRRHLPPARQQGRPAALDRDPGSRGSTIRSIHLFRCSTATVKGTNTAFYSNPALDKLLDDNMHETDKTSAWPPSRAAQKIVIDDAVWGLLWYDNWTRVMRNGPRRHRKALGHVRALLQQRSSDGLSDASRGRMGFPRTISCAGCRSSCRPWSA